MLALDPLLLQVLLWAGGASALLGVLAALSQYELRRLLSFHSVSQVGFMVLALGLGHPLAVASAIFFALHHSLVKSALYLVADELERASASRDLRAMARAPRPQAGTVACFVVAAFSLVGMPPLSGFVAKLGVFRAALEDGAFLGLGLLVVASLFTLASMLKIWRFAFQTRPGSGPLASGFGRGGGALDAMVALIVVLGLAAGPVQESCARAAEALMDGSVYRDAVLQAGLDAPASAGAGRTP